MTWRRITQVTIFEAVEGSPELAKIRAEAEAMKQRALQGTVKTAAGEFGIGKGYSPGANQKFLDAYTKAVQSGTSGRAIMFAVTGNITRDAPEIEKMIAQLQRNKIGKDVQNVESPNLPQSHYQDIIGNPEDLMPPNKESQTETVQAPTRIMTMAPRVDTVDVMAPSLLPSLNPPTMIPSNAVPNNLIDASAETTVGSTLTTGDAYIPGDTSEDDPYNYEIAGDAGNTDAIGEDQANQDLGLGF